jgi:hypothetical protein
MKLLDFNEKIPADSPMALGLTDAFDKFVGKLCAPDRRLLNLPPPFMFRIAWLAELVPLTAAALAAATDGSFETHPADETTTENR